MAGRGTRRNRYLLLALLLLLLVLAVVLPLTLARRGRRPAPPVAVAALSDGAIFRFGAPRGGPEGRLLERRAYQAWHCPRLKVSRWVAYRAEGEDTADRDRYRGAFFADPDLPPGQRAEPADYKGIWRRDRTGFDRGHLAPDASIKRFGLDAQRETYSLANITPQYSVTNQGIWSDLEAAIRSWSSAERPVWVVTGPILFAGRETLRVGSGRVAVPHAYFAILDRNHRPEILAFLVPNTPDASWQTSLAGYLVSVDSVERASGLDFFAELPDSIENRIEVRRPQQVWSRDR